MKKVRVISHYLHDLTDELSFVVTLNDYGHIALNQNKTRISLGKGRVFWDPEWYQFTMIEYDDFHVKLRWKSRTFANDKSTLDILHRPLVPGHHIIYVDCGRRYTYIITNIIDLS